MLEEGWSVRHLNCGSTIYLSSMLSTLCPAGGALGLWLPPCLRLRKIHRGEIKLEAKPLARGLFVWWISRSIFPGDTKSSPFNRKAGIENECGRSGRKKMGQVYWQMVLGLWPYCRGDHSTWWQNYMQQNKADNFCWAPADFCHMEMPDINIFHKI